MIRVRGPRTIRAGIKKVIHVNGAVIRGNKQNGTDRPCYTVKCVDGNFYCRSFIAEGPVYGQQNFDAPLPSGAVVFLQTRAAITLFP